MTALEITTKRQEVPFCFTFDVIFLPSAFLFPVGYNLISFFPLHITNRRIAYINALDNISNLIFTHSSVSNVFHNVIYGTFVKTLATCKVNILTVQGMQNFGVSFSSDNRIKNIFDRFGFFRVECQQLFFAVPNSTKRIAKSNALFFFGSNYLNALFLAFCKFLHLVSCKKAVHSDIYIIVDEVNFITFDFHQCNRIFF